METEISVKNTKNEILAAYDELMKKVQEKKTDEPKKSTGTTKAGNRCKKCRGPEQRRHCKRSIGSES